MNFQETFNSWLEEEHKKLSHHVRDLCYNRKLGTLWYRWIKNDHGLYDWQFNHLEDGHSEQDFPKPNHPSQKAAWGGGKWAKAHVQLTNEGCQGSAKVGHFLIF